MSEFKRGNRYLVIKWRDAVSALGNRELEALQGLADAISEHRKELEKPALECVVVESDWPIYEQTWTLIKQMNADWSDADVQPTPTKQDYRELQSKHDSLLSMLFTVKLERDGLIQQLKQTSDSLNDKIVTMQAAVIDAKQNGPEAGMQWITNTLWGPGLIPVESEPWVNNAQHYYSHNCSNPLGPCGVCGAPSSVSGAGHVACCMDHHKQLKGGAA